MTELNEKRALIAMSGGVDSSMAAKLMLERGFECIGCTMQLYTNEDEDIRSYKTCCSLNDINDARRVCARLDIPHHIYNYKDEFKEKVIDRFIDFYERGMTPNPCIDCNNYIKFGTLFEKADELNCKYIVTGHYARVVEDNGVYYLKKAVDLSKDQSYFLYGITQDKLKRVLFPLGEYEKPYIRVLADEAGFVNAKKHDSQDICFVPDGDYAKVIRENTKKEYPEGNFTDKDGNVLGKHKGIINYTIGQRRGLGISAENPYYVCELNLKCNEVVLSDNDALFKRELTASDMNWISGIPDKNELRCGVRIRYRHKEQPAKVTLVSENEIHIEFDEPQRAITKGQAAVLYDGDCVLGGGIITDDK